MWFAGKAPSLPSSTHLNRPAPSGLCWATFPGKGPTGQAGRPRQGYIGSLRKTKTERGGGKTLPSYITLPPWQGEKKSSPPQCKEKPVHPPLPSLQRLRHFRTGIWATLKAALLACNCTTVAALQTQDATTAGTSNTKCSESNPVTALILLGRVNIPVLFLGECSTYNMM